MTIRRPSPRRTPHPVIPPRGGPHASISAWSAKVRNLFDADGVKLEPSDVLTKRQREADDDKRILNELPPHWAVFSERGR